MADRHEEVNKLGATLFLLVTIAWQLASLVLLLYYAFSNATWDSWEKFSGTLEHLTTVLALVVGGLWAYKKFIQGRIGKPRLEQSLQAKIVSFGATRCVSVSALVKNVGLTRVSFDKNGSGLDVFTWVPVPNEPYWYTPVWKAETTFTIFEEHHGIEPGTSIAEETLIFLPANDASIIKLDLVLVSHESDKEWHCATIVEAEERPDTAKT